MKRITLCSILLLISSMMAFAQADLQPLANIKLHKSESITLKQLKNRVESYKLQTGMTSFTVEQKKEILDAMIDEILVVQAAQKAGITVTDSEVNEYFLSNMAQQIGQQLTEAQLAQLVKQQTGMSLDQYIKAQVGMTLSEYKEYIKNQLLVSRFILSQKQDELASVVPTDADIRAFYEMNKASFVQNDILKLFLVLVPKGKDEKAAQKKITSIYEDIKSKKTTPDKLKVAQKNDTTYQAGDLYVSKSAQAAQQLGISYEGLLELFTKDVEYISEITSTDVDFQFYIIRNKYGAKMLELSDVVQPDSTMTIYEYIRQNLTVQQQNQFMATAAQELTQELRTPENFQMLKTGSALDKLLEGW